MKMISKILTVALTAVAGVGTLGGAIMFAVGGSTNVKLQNDATPIELINTGIGWLNFQNDSVFLLKIIPGLKDYNEFLEFTKSTRGQEELKLIIKDTEDLLTLPNLSIESKDSLKEQIKSLNVMLTAPALYNLSIAGVSIMSIGIVLAALSAAVAINIENAEERKKSKKNNTENN